MKKYTMLIADANVDNRELVRNYFSNFYDIKLAQNSEEALALLRTEDISILITDLFLPGMDGFSLISRIRNDHAFDSLAILAVTNQGDSFELKALQLGANDFLSRPFQMELLAHRVQSALYKASSFHAGHRHFAYNYLRLPFATVKLISQSRGSAPTAELLYVNETFAETFSLSRQRLQTGFYNIKRLDFVQFLQSLQAKGPSRKQTFQYADTGKYYDVTAYREADDFCSFILIENTAAQLRQQQLEQHERLIGQFMKSNPRTLGALHLDLTDDVCLSGMGLSPYFNNKVYPIAFEALVEELYGFAATEEALHTARTRLCRTALLEAFTRGNTEEQVEIETRMMNGTVCWLTIYSNLSRNPENGHVECVISAVNEDEQKRYQEILDVVIHKDYDMTFYVDMRLDTAKVLTCKTNTLPDSPMSIADMDAAIGGYLQKHFIGENKETFLRENTLVAIAKKMADRDTYVVDCRLREDDGKIHLKRGTYYWLDSSRQHLCFTRADITDSFEAEQRHSEMLERALQEARADERRQIEAQQKREALHYEEVRQKDLMLKNLVHNIPGGIAIYKIADPLVVRYTSDGVAKLTGRTTFEYVEWIKGDMLKKTVYAEDLPRVQEEVFRCATKGFPINISFRTPHRDGRLIWVLLSAIKIREEGDSPIYYAVLTPMSTQVAQYTELCEDAPTAIYVANKTNYQLLFLNREAQRLSGRTESYHGHTCYSYLMHAEEPCSFCPFAHVAQDSAYSSKSIEVPHLSGVYTLSCRAAEWDGIPASVCYLSDETYRIRAQEEALKLQKAEAANRAKSNFLARMSHDMRTPMNGILGLANLMRDRSNLNQVQSDLDQLEMSAQYLLNLINDTLDMSKIENGLVELHPVVCDGKQLIHNMLHLLQPNIQQKQLDFRVEQDENLFVPLYVDVGRFEQLVMNVLSNAVKFTPTGGTISFFMKSISSENNILREEFTVQDSGIGISEEFLPHIFEAFSQESTQTSNRTQGTGLGMPIAKQLTELMNGEIHIQSKKNKGTTVVFTVDLPLATQEQMLFLQQPADAVTDLSVLRDKRILLCEDHSLNAQIALRLLTKEFVSADWAENGQLGLERFVQSPPGYYSAVLMDIRMPVMDGLETAAALRALSRPDAQTIPIIAMTANAFDEDVKKSREAGMDAHLSKPIEPEKLFVTLAQLVRDGRPVCPAQQNFLP